MSGKDPVARALVESSLELHRRRLWQEVPGDAPFLIRVPGEEAPLVATIMGHLGSDYGLFLARGEDAFAQTVAIHRERGQRTDALELLSVLSVCIDPIGDIPPDHRGLLHDAGFHPSHDGLAPLALAKPAHRRPRTPNRAESRLLLTSLRAILAVHAAGELEPKSLDSRRKRVFEIVVEGEGRDARFHSHIASWPKRPRRLE
jgi:hypothetical protein